MKTTTKFDPAIVILLWLLLLAAVMFFFPSCATQKRCSMKFPPKVEVIQKDSIYEIITFRDTTIYIQLEGKIVTKTDTVYVQNGVILNKEIRGESKFATAIAGIAKNKLYLRLTDKDTTLEIKLNNAIKMARYFEMKFNTEKKVEYIEKDLTKWQKFLIVSGIIFLGVILIWLLLKVKRFL